MSTSSQPPSMPPAPDRPSHDGPAPFYVYVEGELIETYAPDQFPDLDAVLDDLLVRFDALYPEEYIRWDLAVWREGLLHAIVRPSPDGPPEAIRIEPQH